MSAHPEAAEPTHTKEPERLDRYVRRDEAREMRLQIERLRAEKEVIKEQAPRLVAHAEMVVASRMASEVPR